MDKIATDNLNGAEWFYDDGWYIQQLNGKEVSRLSLKNFPNPNDVWEKKIRKSQDVVMRDLTQDERDRLKPRAYIFTLWEHRQENYVEA